MTNRHVREGVNLELDSPTQVKPSDDEPGHQLDYGFMGDTKQDGRTAKQLPDSQPQTLCEMILIY